MCSAGGVSSGIGKINKLSRAQVEIEIHKLSFLRQQGAGRRSFLPFRWNLNLTMFEEKFEHIEMGLKEDSSGPKTGFSGLENLWARFGV